MGSPPDRSELLRRILDELRLGVHVEENFQQLFGLFHRPLHYFFAKRGFSPEDCSDLTQETFLGIYRNIGTFRAEGSFEGWLFQIATNVFRKRLRFMKAEKRGQEVPLSPLEEERPDERSEPDAILLGKERVALLLQEMKRLPPKMRACFLLRVYHHRKYREIAQLLNLSIDSVKVHLSEARKRMRHTLEQHHDHTAQ